MRVIHLKFNDAIPGNMEDYAIGDLVIFDLNLNPSGITDVYYAFEWIGYGVYGPWKPIPYAEALEKEKTLSNSGQSTESFSYANI